MSTKRLIKDLINRYKILNGRKYFTSGILQNYLIFLSAKRYFGFFTNTSQVYSQKSKEFSEESIENITVLDSKFARTSINYYLLPNVKFNGHYI